MGEMLQLHGSGAGYSEKIRSHWLRCDTIFIKMSLYACKMCEPERSLNVADISGTVHGHSHFLDHYFYNFINEH